MPFDEPRAPSPRSLLLYFLLFSVVILPYTPQANNITILDDQAASRSSAYKKPPPLEIHIYIQIEPGSQATKRMLSESDGLRVPKRRTQSEQDSPRIRGVQLTEAGGASNPHDCGGERSSFSTHAYVSRRTCACTCRPPRHASDRYHAYASATTTHHIAITPPMGTTSTEPCDPIIIRGRQQKVQLDAPAPMGNLTPPRLC